MRVFVTGATGFIGSAIVPELIKAGHEVTGLARSDKAVQVLTAQGADVQRGNLEDLDALRAGAANSDGVIHAGFIHEFSRFKEVCEIDRRAIDVLGSVFVGSDRPLVITSGTAIAAAPGRIATEDDAPVMTSNDFPRVASEEAASALTDRGVNVSVVRLSPSVHGDDDHGFLPMLIAMAREKGRSAYVGEGANRWTAVHRLDAARLFRLAIEAAAPAARYHGADETAIPFRDVARAIGERLNIPVESVAVQDAERHFGGFAGFAQMDAPATSDLTRQRLGWRPTQVGLIEDLMTSRQYFHA